MLEHGGRLRLAAAHYGIALSDWLDLSTGINPNGWKVAAVPSIAWSRLPENDDGLEAAACAYYGCNSLMPVAGSQAVIQTMPPLRPSSRVGVVHPGYAEHAHAWRRAGHAVMSVSTEDVHNTIPQLDLLVLIHPNNPTGERLAPEQLLDWHVQLAARGGWLVVDEAFMDATPEDSLARFCPRPGLIVLRSLGKFFGLAGARVGFVLAAPDVLDALSDGLGPWTVAGPSRFVATQALEDRTWQETARARLARETRRLAGLLSRHGLAPDGGSALFQWVQTPRAAVIHESLARRGILTRLFKEPPGLRFGLPGSEAPWQRLEAALADVCATTPAEATP